MDLIYLRIALPVPLHKTFIYSYVGNNENYKGCRVNVPFGKGKLRELTGVVIDQSNNLEDLNKELNVSEIKSVSEILDIKPIFSENMLKFLIWISSYYFSPIGETIKAAIPNNILPKSVFKFIFNTDITTLKKIILNSHQIKIMQLLLTAKESVTIEQIQEYCNIKNIRSDITFLLNHDLIKFEIEHKVKIKEKKQKVVKIAEKLLSNKELLTETINLLNLRKPTQKQSQILAYLFDNYQNNPVTTAELSKLFKSVSAINSLEKKGFVTLSEEEINRSAVFNQTTSLAFKDESKLPLTDEQLNCVNIINENIAKNEYAPFLLHGITGSGKTLVYIHAIKKALELNKTVLLLVPEISLTPQLIDRFNIIFPNIISVFHSKMSDAERYDSWRAVLNRKTKIVIGARSALFTPLDNLGLIIVDEEHETSYKQDSQLPFYHGKDAAIYRAMLEHATIVLGSATPSLESYYNTHLNKIKLLEIKNRVDKAVLPKVEIVDIGSAKRSGQYFNGFSTILIDKIKEKVSKHEGIILFQNRRGYASFLECEDCGFVPQCKNCSTSLTYHQVTNELKCHYCGYSQPVPKFCDSCGHEGLEKFGSGTQRIEDALNNILLESGFEAKIDRLDLDTTQKKDNYRKILESFAQGKTDILLGTQMVAKGLDFDRVSLVGVIDADVQLNIPDFRAAERTFQLISQVSGRAGRGQDLLGEVVIQTYNLDNYAIINAAKSDFNNFYKLELQKRQDALFPPFVRFCIIEFVSDNELKLKNSANIFYSLIDRHKALIVYPPQPAALTKLNNKYRWQIIIKDIKVIDIGGRILHNTINNTLERYYKTDSSKDVTIKIDIDAYSSM